MPLLSRIAPLALALVICAPSFAGEDKESSTRRPGLFFAWLAADAGTVSVRFDNPAQLRELARHCKAGNAVFSLENGSRHQCVLETPQLPAGEASWESASVSVTGAAAPGDANQFSLFSTRPPVTTRWSARALHPQERAALEAVLQSDPRRWGIGTSPLKLRNASVVGRPGGSSAAVIVPGRVVEDRRAFYRAQRHHVFLQQGSGYTYLGEIPGKPIKFVDIDGKDLPGLVASEGCDGWCISLWSLAGGLRPMGTFGGH